MPLGVGYVPVGEFCEELQSILVAASFPGLWVNRGRDYYVRLFFLEFPRYRVYLRPYV